MTKISWLLEWEYFLVLRGNFELVGKDSVGVLGGDGPLNPDRDAYGGLRLRRTAETTANE